MTTLFWVSNSASGVEWVSHRHCRRRHRQRRRRRFSWCSSNNNNNNNNNTNIIISSSSIRSLLLSLPRPFSSAKHTLLTLIMFLFPVSGPFSYAHERAVRSVYWWFIRPIHWSKNNDRNMLWWYWWYHKESKPNKSGVILYKQITHIDTSYSIDYWSTDYIRCQSISKNVYFSISHVWGV